MDIDLPELLELIREMELLLKNEKEKDLLKKVKEGLTELIEQRREMHEADIKILEEYFDDQEKENEDLMREISASIRQIEALKQKNTELSGKIADDEILKAIINNNKARIEKLRAKSKENKALAKELKKEKDTLNKSWAAKYGWLRHFTDVELRATIKHYAGRLGALRRKYNSAIKSLEDIYMETYNQHFKNLENFKGRIRGLCTDSIEICPECNMPVSHCACDKKS